MNVLPQRRTLVHKAIEPRKLSAKVRAAVEARPNNIYEVKYDGCHVILIKANGVAHAFSRQGEPVVAAMRHVLDDLNSIADDNFVLFAEAWHPELEHSVINGTFRRTYVDEDAQLLEAVVFDYVPLADFLAGTCPVRFKTRRDYATAMMYRVDAGYKEGSRPYIYMSVASESLEYCAGVVADQREFCGKTFAIDGYMQKDPDGTWKAGAGSGGESVKLKDHMSIDVKVLRVLEGKGKFEGMVGSIVVQWGDKELTVGGGTMRDHRRKFYWDFPSHIIGRIIEVHGLSESANGMIREPRFIRFRDDKTEGE